MRKIDGNSDVIIVGSGVSGIAVADSLRNYGLSSCVIEAGDSTAVPGAIEFRSTADYKAFVRPALEVDPEVWAYEADSEKIDWVRTRACGGRSIRWGGWLATPDAVNFDPRYNGGVSWPLRHAQIERLLARAAGWLGARRGSLREPFSSLGLAAGFNVLPKTGAVSLDLVRPFHSFDALAGVPRLGKEPQPVRVCPNSVVASIICGGGGVEAVEIIDRLTGNSRRMRSRAVVLCASPIETARLLLTLETGRQSVSLANVGKHYLDHVSASYMVLFDEPFSGIPVAAPLERGAIVSRPRGCSLESRMDVGGFTLELHGPDPLALEDPRIIETTGLATDTEATCISVNAIGELRRSHLRHVELGEQKDSLGRRVPKIHIDWDPHTRTLANHMENEVERVANILAGKSGRVVKVRETLSLGGTSASHEAGTCPMGADVNTSVTDAAGHVRDIPGLFIGDASLMPTSLDCHPTLVVVGLAMNTADGVARYVKSTGTSDSRRL